MYILDTSALQAIGASKLRARQPHVKLAISPLTFYELLSHLEDTGKKSNFAKKKAIVLKCRIPEILQDAAARHAAFVGVSDLSDPTRDDETALIPKMLEGLSQSESLESFYSQEILDSKGVRLFFSKIGERTNQWLKKREEEYIKLIDELRADFKILFPEFPHKPITDADLVRQIVARAGDALKGYDAVASNDDLDLPVKIIRSVYIYFGYMHYRTLDYMTKEFNAGSYNPDPNDFEDSYIAFNLDILRDDALVTGDHDALKAVQRTIDSFQHIAAVGVKPLARVIDVKTFLAETSNES